MEPSSTDGLRGRVHGFPFWGGQGVLQMLQMWGEWAAPWMPRGYLVEALVLTSFGSPDFIILLVCFLKEKNEVNFWVGI